MNVSSVKNLNGETFSAVQDTFLTDIVSINSANWNEISAYQANSGNFLTAVPAGTMNESAFEYDASDNITAYNGSAFKAGDEFPQSATEAIETVTANSADWNGTTDTVSSNSGVWGGSALPISAGPGIKFEMVDNTLVASVDETVLWSGADTPGIGSTLTNKNYELSEDITNFENIKIYLGGRLGQTVQFGSGANPYITAPDSTANNNIIGLFISHISGNNTALNFKCGYSTSYSNAYRAGIDWGYYTLYKIVGITRIAGV